MILLPLAVLLIIARAALPSLVRDYVNRVLMVAPELNFGDALTSEGDQTGADGPWLGMLEELFPFQINRAIIENGSMLLLLLKCRRSVAPEKKSCGEFKRDRD